MFSEIKKGIFMTEEIDLWAKYEKIGYKQKNRIMYGDPAFSVNERSYLKFFQVVRRLQEAVDMMIFLKVLELKKIFQL